MQRFNARTLPQRVAEGLGVEAWLNSGGRRLYLRRVIYSCLGGLAVAMSLFFLLLFGVGSIGSVSSAAVPFPVSAELGLIGSKNKGVVPVFQVGAPREVPVLLVGLGEGEPPSRVFAVNKTVNSSLKERYSLGGMTDFTFGVTAVAFNLLGYSLIGNQAELTRSELEKLDPSDINSIDRKWAGRYNAENAMLSDVALGASILVGLSSVSILPESWVTVLVMHAEVNGIATGVSQIVKGSVRRHRPRAYKSSTLDIEAKLQEDQVNSFFSGHSTTIAANLFFFTKVYLDKHTGTHNKNLIWGGVSAVSAALAWQRVLAGAHFPSDVTLGVLWGGLVGYWVPELRGLRSGVSITPVFEGVAAAPVFGLTASVRY